MVVSKNSTLNLVDAEVLRPQYEQLDFREDMSAREYVDHYFDNSMEWVVLHDLHVRTQRSPVHLDHVLINEQLEFTLLDTRYLFKGLEIVESGKCYAYSGKQRQLIASPLTKMQRDTRALTELLKKNKQLKRYFGIKRPVCVQGYILTHPRLRNSKPLQCDLDTSSVIAADSLFFMIWQKPAHWLNLKLKPVNRRLLGDLASELQSHCVQVGSKKSSAVNPEMAALQQTRHCMQCGQLADSEEIEYCARNRDAFAEQVLCSRCRKLS